MGKIYRHITAWLLVTCTILSGCGLRMYSSAQSSDANVSLGLTFLQQGNLEKARLALNQAVAAQPQSPASWGAMAYLEERCGNLTLAGQDYRRAIELAPAQGEGYNNYGVFLCRHGQQRAGIRALLQAVQLPSYVHRAGAYQNAGLCAATIPDPAAAATYFKLARQNGLTVAKPDHKVYT